MQSAIYKGWVRHRRFSPAPHQLRYSVFMMLLDLAELDKVFAGSWLWSTRRWALARFKRADYLGDPAVPLDTAVRRRVAELAGVYPEGPIRLLTNVRYFGFIINPISCYYCFDNNEQLQFIIAEVNNTPWDERHSYVLQCKPESKYQRIRFNKQLHVSPFNPMDIEYDWRSSLPEQQLRIHMQNWREVDGGQLKEFDATLVLEREPLSVKALRLLLCQYPLMTIKVVAAIYWQAIKLWCKKVPIYDHPGNDPAGKASP
jgi:DUF1365 family protein